MDFFPTFAHLGGGKVQEWPIDGVNQTDLLLGKNDTGRRDELLTFTVGPIWWLLVGSSFASILLTWRLGAAAGEAPIFLPGRRKCGAP